MPGGRGYETAEEVSIKCKENRRKEKIYEKDSKRNLALYPSGKKVVEGKTPKASPTFNKKANIPPGGALETGYAEPGNFTSLFVLQG